MVPPSAPSKVRSREPRYLLERPYQWPIDAAFLVDAEFNAAQAVALGLYAARIAIPVGGAAAVFGLLFVPSPNNVSVEGEVPEIPGLRYSWIGDETVLHLTYDGVDGARRTFALKWDGNSFATNVDMSWGTSLAAIGSSSTRLPYRPIWRSRTSPSYARRTPPMWLAATRATILQEQDSTVRRLREAVDQILPQRAHAERLRLLPAESRGRQTGQLRRLQ